MCFRTQVAIRAITAGDNEWERFVKEETESKKDLLDANVTIATQIIMVYIQEAKQNLKQLKEMENSIVPLNIRSILIQRYWQIEQLFEKALDLDLNLLRAFDQARKISH